MVLSTLAGGTDGGIDGGTDLHVSAFLVDDVRSIFFLFFLSFVRNFSCHYES
jgi:hypothetical protein